MSFAKELVEADVKIAALKKERDKLVELVRVQTEKLDIALKALEFYANDRNWKSHMSVTDGIVEAMTTDDRFGCDRAKCALAEIENFKDSEP